MDEQTRKGHRRIFEKSLAAFPELVAAKARAEFPGSADCYRLKDDLGHYFLIAFVPPEGEELTAQVTAVMLHGTDSTLPGELVYKVPFTQLVMCDCGEWEMPEGVEIHDYGIDTSKAGWN